MLLHLAWPSFNVMQIICVAMDDEEEQVVCLLGSFCYEKFNVIFGSHHDSWHLFYSVCWVELDGESVVE